MNILALDLGTHLGYAILHEKEIISGTKKLKNKTFGQRFLDFLQWLHESCEVGEIKKYIAGHGRATKNEVVKAVSNLGFSPADDNEADALAILLLAIAKKEGQPLNGHHRRKIFSQIKSGPSSNLRERTTAPRDLASDRGFLEVDLAHYYSRILENAVNEGLRS